MTSKIVLATMILLGVSTAWALKATKEHKFSGSPDGANPATGLVADGAGNFYGTTDGGGLKTCGFSAPFCGTVYKATFAPDGTWKEKVIYSFKGGNDGAAPSGTLIFDGLGNLYGTTVTGGNSLCNGEGCGTVFKLSPSSTGTWTETILYRFLASTDGAQPGSGVIFDAAGNIYGTTDGGGCIEECNGIIFKLAPNPDGTWTESILYTFLGGLDGGFPTALVLDSSGNLIGASASGGIGNSICDCGTVYQLSPAANTASNEAAGTTWTKTILYSFNDGLDGGNPSSPLKFDHAGNLFGETFDGGSFACPQSGCGVVYELSPGSEGWSFSTAFTFNGVDGSKGSQPTGGLGLDSEGNLYGMTSGGGDLACNNGNGCGTVFKLTPRTAGGFAYSMLFEFNGATGSDPEGGVIVDATGNVYGTTFAGGNPTCNCGVTFAITP